jgi:excisionase family DNA binding protein
MKTQNQLQVLKNALTKLTTDANENLKGSNLVSPFLTLPELAELLDVSKATINSYVSNGTLVKHKFANKVRFKKDDIISAIIKLQEKIGITDINISDDPLNMSIEDVANYLKISVTTVKSYVKKEIITKHGTGKNIYFRKEEIDANILKQNLETIEVKNTPLEDTSGYITLVEAAKALKVSIPEIHFYAKTGLINKERKNGYVVVRLQEVMDIPAKIKTAKSLIN